MAKKVILKIVYDKIWDGYQVRYIEDGEINWNKTYHTDDYNDACETMNIMRKELDVSQHTRLNQMGDNLNIPKRKGKNNGTRTR